jgi:hypothetical protein
MARLGHFQPIPEQPSLSHIKRANEVRASRGCRQMSIRPSRGDLQEGANAIQPGKKDGDRNATGMRLAAAAGGRETKAPIAPLPVGEAKAGGSSRRRYNGVARWG